MRKRDTTQFNFKILVLVIHDRLRSTEIFQGGNIYFPVRNNDSAENFPEQFTKLKKT